MAMYVPPYSVVEFKEVAGGMIVPTHPYPTRFFVTREIIDFGRRFEFRKVTFWGLMLYALQNLITDIWWWSLKRTWIWGFLDPPEAVVVNWACIKSSWRWKFWTPRKNPGPRGR